jgi:penicillin-binding protein 2
MSENTNIRIVILKCVMLLVGVVFIMQLFNLQVIHGEEYRAQAQNRTLRKTQVTAPRGEMLDRYGEVLATNRNGYNIMIYRSKLESEERNEMLLKLMEMLKVLLIKVI